MRRGILCLLLGLCLCVPQEALASPQKPSTTKPKPAPTPATDAKPATQPTAAAVNQWALLVGVSSYPGGIQSLTFPRDDARAIRDMLVSSAGFPEDHVRLLTDDGVGDARATKQNILAAIDGYLAPRVQAGHEVIVFLAGHGIARGLGVQAKSYFLPVDVDAQSKDSLERTGLDLEELARRLSALKASQFSIFIDACREDPFPGRGIKGNTMTDVMTRGLRIAPAAGRPADSPPPTAIVFYACQIGERAYEDAKLKHGVFTYYIIDGIREIANKPDGRVEAGSLAGFLRDKVQKWSADFQAQARFPVDQTPMMVATEVRGPLVIVRLSQSAANPPSPPTTGTLVLAT